MDEISYAEQQEVLKQIADQSVIELYKLQFLSQKCDPVGFFTKHKLEDKVVRLDDVGRGYEEMILRLGWKAMIEEGKKKVKKYARIARVFLPALRKIFYVGFDKRDAQLLMAEMMVQSTVPFNDLGNGFGGDNYTDLDSYTGQPLDQITPQQERMDLGDCAAPIIPQLGDGFTARITQAYEHMKPTLDKVTSEADAINIYAEQATNASRESYDISEEIQYEEREREDGPIQQENDLMLHLNMGEVYSLIRTFRKLWNKRNKWGGKVFPWWLKEIAPLNYEPQNLLAVMLTFKLDDMLPSIYCPLPGISNLQVLDNLFGSDILDEFVDLYDDITDKEGSARNILTEDEIRAIAKGFENDIINTFNGDKIPHTRVYASGVFNALATGESDLTGAGYKNWRWNKSKQGCQAFDFAYCQAKFEGANERDAYKIAWHKFWKAGFIVKVHSDGLTIASEGNGRSRRINWERAISEIATELIRFGKDEKKKLLGILMAKNWGAELIESVRI